MIIRFRFRAIRWRDWRSSSSAWWRKISRNYGIWYLPGSTPQNTKSQDGLWLQRYINLTNIFGIWMASRSKFRQKSLAIVEVGNLKNVCAVKWSNNRWAISNYLRHLKCICFPNFFSIFASNLKHLEGVWSRGMLEKTFDAAVFGACMSEYLYCFGGKPFRLFWKKI